MATFKSLAESETNANHKQIFSILAKHETEQTQDGVNEIVLDSSELCAIRDTLYSEVHENLSSESTVQSVSQLKESLMLKTKSIIQNKAAFVQDGYFNPVSGIGTLIDPGMETQSFIPVSITPTEAAAYYSSGGLAARIINKKSGCISLEGLHFQCSALEPDELKRLEDYAKQCGFYDAYAQGITQSLIFGGAVVYPVLGNDNPLNTQLDMSVLLQRIPEKNFIRYWVTCDRWNCVFVPEYNITAQDYLYARTIFIPLGGTRINTQRAAMIRPIKLPFWAAIKQMGWSTSDFEGWIKDYEGYQIMKMSLPIMAQQMSLMYHQFPTDGIMAENGPDYMKELFKENEEEMRKWSMLHPKAINSVGEIKILERTYTGFQQLITESRLALCASAGIAESILFAQKSTGLASDNEDDVTLKQSESIRLLFNNVAPAFKNCIELLVYSCFGKNSPQAEHAKTVTIKPDSGIILSDQDKAQLGVQFSQIASQLASMGLPLNAAVVTAHKCVPSIELDNEMLKQLEEGESENIDSDLWQMINAGRDI